MDGEPRGKGLLGIVVAAGAAPSASARGGPHHSDVGTMFARFYSSNFCGTMIRLMN